MDLTNQEFPSSPNTYISNPELLNTSQLLISYNDLSNSFRDYVASHSNDYAVKLALELQAENKKLKNEKIALSQQIVRVLEENQILRVGGADAKDKNEIFDVLNKNLWKLENENSQEVRELRAELSIAKDVIDKQDKAIKAFELELKCEGNKFKMPGLEGVVKDYYALKAKFEDLSETCERYRGCCKELKNQLSGVCEEVRELRRAAADLNDEKNLLEKMQESLIYENSSQSKIIKNYENLTLNQINHFYTSDITNQIQCYIKKILELNQANCTLSIQNQDLETKLSYLQTQSIHHSNSLKKSISEKQELSSIHEEKLRKLLEKSENEQKRSEELQKDLENLQTEFEEVQKLAKRTKNELESVKTVLGRKIDQLEKTVQGKTEEIAKLESTNQKMLEKLVTLLYQTTKYAVDKE